MRLDGERVASATIQRALPPSGEVVERIGQALCVQPLSGEVEDGDLLAWSAGEGKVAPKKMYAATPKGREEDARRFQVWNSFSQTVDGFLQEE